MPREPLTSTRSPGASEASSRSAASRARRRRARPRRRPGRRRARRRQAPPRPTPPTATSREMPALTAACPHSTCSGCANAPSSSISPSTAILRAMAAIPADGLERPHQRRRARVVGVVDERHARAQPDDLAAVPCRTQRRGAFDDVVRAARRAGAPRRSRRARSCRLPSPSSGTRRSASPSGVRTCARVPSTPSSSIRALRGSSERARRAERDHAPGERRRARHHARVVSIGDEHGGRRGALEDLRLRVGNRFRRAEEPEMRVSDVRPHPHLGFGERHQPADLAGMVHPELHDRDVRPGAQFEQRERQPDVVVEIAGVPVHRVTRRRGTRR